MSEQVEHVRHIVDSFVSAYMRTRPWSDYVNAVGLTTRAIAKWRIDDTRPFEEVRAEIEEAGEDPNETYLFVGLRRSLPDDLELPEEYRGMKLHVELLGEAHPL